MANFCGMCGTRLDEKTGQCPNQKCKAYKHEPASGAGVVRKTRKLVIPVCLCVMILLIGIISGQGGAAEEAACQHQWSKATCNSPQTCNFCGETEGAALEHTYGEWEEAYDVKENVMKIMRRCGRCSAILDTHFAELTTLIQGDLFRLSPQDFVKRYVSILGQFFDECSYELVENESNLLAVRITCDKEYKLMMSFSRDIYDLLDASDWDQVAARAISITGPLDDANNCCRAYHAFLMATNPQQNMDTAYEDGGKTWAAMYDNAMQGEQFTDFTQDGISYSLYPFESEQNGLEFACTAAVPEAK